MIESASLPRAASPRISIVIPVFNEASLLESSIASFLDAIEAADLEERAPFELILAENGSDDGTAKIADELSGRLGPVRALHIAEPNYGRALREGIMAARGDFVLCDEIDLCDLDFHQRALKILAAGDADLVVGSKALASAHDERPLLRRMGTRVINGLLRLTLGFEGTDTHGLKAFRRQALLEVVEACVVERDLFASEFVLRAARMGKRVVEIPVAVREKRRPSINLIRRVPNVLFNLGKLVLVIRLRER